MGRGTITTGRGAGATAAGSSAAWEMVGAGFGITAAGAGGETRLGAAGTAGWSTSGGTTRKRGSFVSDVTGGTLLVTATLVDGSTPAGTARKRESFGSRCASEVSCPAAQVRRAAGGTRNSATTKARRRVATI